MAAMEFECFRLQTELSALPPFNEALCARLAAEPNPLDASAVPTVLLLLDELLTNVIKYAHPAGSGAEHAMDVRIFWNASEFSLEIEDDGAPFDPTQPRPVAAAAEDPAAWEDRPVGGWGLALVRETVDEFTYRREESMNKLTLRKRLHPASGGANHPDAASSSC